MGWAFKKWSTSILASWALVWAELQDNSEVDLLKELPFSTSAWPAAVWPVPPAHQWKGRLQDHHRPFTLTLLDVSEASDVADSTLLFETFLAGFPVFLGSLTCLMISFMFPLPPHGPCRHSARCPWLSLPHLHLQPHLLLGSSCFKPTVLSSGLSSSQLP